MLGVRRPSSQAPALVHSITGAGGLSTRTVVQAARRYDEYPEAGVLGLGRIERARIAAEQADDGEAVDALLLLRDREREG